MISSTAVRGGKSSSRMRATAVSTGSDTLYLRASFITAPAVATPSATAAQSPAPLPSSPQRRHLPGYTWGVVTRHALASRGSKDLLIRIHLQLALKIIFEKLSGVPTVVQGTKRLRMQRG